MKAFQEDWIAETPQAAAAAAAASKSASSASQPTFSQQRAATRDTNFGPGGQDQKQEAPDVVRPGRLLTTLHAMRQELEVQLVSAGGCKTCQQVGAIHGAWGGAFSIQGWRADDAACNTAGT
jgi:hypothetical protein